MYLALKTYCANRLFEWIMTFAMLGIAVEIMFWPGTIGSSAFRLMLRIISAESVGIFFLICGTVRIAALIANGSWPVYGPPMRAFTAAAAAFVWMQMFVALLLLVPSGMNTVPSPGIPVYLALVFGELISCYRAISDAGRR